MIARPSIDRELVVRLTRELVRIPSVNPPGNELPAAEYLTGQMSDLGLEVELQLLEPGRANLVAGFGPTMSGALVFTGHLDVVPPGAQPWAHDPFAAELSDGRIYGRGTTDMKGGVAAIVAALASLSKAEVKLKSKAVLAATAGEEAGMLGAIALVDSDRLRGARNLVVAEPSNLDAYIAEKGVLWLEIKAFGRTAHGSMPELGVNAVSFMARLLQALEQYNFTFTESPLLGTPSLSVNIFNGGNKSNVVPDVAGITADIRTVPGQNHAAIIKEVHDIASRLARDFHPDLRVEIGIENDKQPVETDPKNALVQAVVESVRYVRGEDPIVGGVPYGTDAAALGPGLGIPMVICGPGSPSMAHQPDEYVDIDQLVQAAEIYVDLALRLAG